MAEWLTLWIALCICFFLGLIYARLGRVCDALYYINENLIILAEGPDYDDDPSGEDAPITSLDRGETYDKMDKTISRLRTVINDPRRAA